MKKRALTAEDDEADGAMPDGVMPADDLGAPMLTFEEMAAREDEMAELYAWIENDGARADDGASAADGVSVKSPADVSDPDGGASAATAIYMETADYATPASAAAATRA